MSDNLQIRPVTVELLRAGPSHNQLLSPLTPYLGICDDAEAGIVTLPYEHAVFLRRMKSMRYASGEEIDRLPVLRDLGVDMAKVLGTIPRLPGSLAGDSAAGSDSLVHLRLVLSAAELAALPFELAKIPIGPANWAEGWLSLQARTPVVITRRTRNVSSAGVRWPLRPRILFVAADPDEVPFEEHRNELLAAIRPFRYPRRDDPVVDGRREQFGNLLTIIKDARFDEVVAECAAQRYTHIHVLAHGMADPAVEDTSYGLVLKTADGESNVISGERFASAFTCLVGNSIHRPAVVTLASCDSANEGSVIVPGASIAHVLHQAGIALVVASQFPLSKSGANLMTQEFYRGLLWGESPWILLHRIRTGLHGRLVAHSHDWASLVVYEALPASLPEQLEELRYRQARAAIDAAFEHLDRDIAQPAGPPDPQRRRQLVQAVTDASDRLPIDGRFAMECYGLLASSSKRLAEAEFTMARAANATAQDPRPHLLQCCAHLEQSLRDYEVAVKGFLVNQGRPVQRIASLHWVLAQQLCLSAVLGKAVPAGSWETARLSAEAYLDQQDLDERSWAHGSLAELWLLRLADPALPASQRPAAAQQAREHAMQLINLYRSGDAFPIASTRRQFVRYVEWWGQPLLEDAIRGPGVTGRCDWREAGLVAAAGELVEILDRRGVVARAAPVDAPTTAPAAPAAPTEPTTAPTARPPAKKSAKLARPKGAAANAVLETSRRPKAATASGTTVLSVEMLPAGHGDSLWLQYGTGAATAQVLVDCGTDSTYPQLRQRVERLPAEGRHFELFILSHIDADHIGGAIPFFKDTSLGVSFADVWFNGWKHLAPARLGAKQGEIFSTLIQQQKLPWNQWRQGGAIVLSGDTLPTCTLPGGMQLTLLSPTAEKLATLGTKWAKEIEALGLTPGKAEDFEKFLGRTPSKSTNVDALADARFTPDAAANNGSSIAVLAEFGGKSVLLGADAHAPLLVASIRRLLKQRGVAKLALSAFKVPHHGSQNNLNIELVQLLECRNYLISTNGDHFNHPDREAIGRIIKYGGEKPTLWFNFRTALNEVWAGEALQRKYGYTAVYPPDGAQGLVVAL